MSSRAGHSKPEITSPITPSQSLPQIEAKTEYSRLLSRHAGSRAEPSPPALPPPLGSRPSHRQHTPAAISAAIAASDERLRSIQAENSSFSSSSSSPASDKLAIEPLEFSLPQPDIVADFETKLKIAHETITRYSEQATSMRETISVLHARLQAAAAVTQQVLWGT